MSLMPSRGDDSIRGGKYRERLFTKSPTKSYPEYRLQQKGKARPGEHVVDNKTIQEVIKRTAKEDQEERTSKTAKWKKKHPNMEFARTVARVEQLTPDPVDPSDPDGPRTCGVIVDPKTNQLTTLVIAPWAFDPEAAKETGTYYVARMADNKFYQCVTESRFEAQEADAEEVKLVEKEQEEIMRRLNEIQLKVLREKTTGQKGGPTVEQTKQLNQMQKLLTFVQNKEAVDIMYHKASTHEQRVTKMARFLQRHARDIKSQLSNIKDITTKEARTTLAESIVTCSENMSKDDCSGTCSWVAANMHNGEAVGICVPSPMEKEVFMDTSGFTGKKKKTTEAFQGAIVDTVKSIKPPGWATRLAGGAGVGAGAGSAAPAYAGQSELAMALSGGGDVGYDDFDDGSLYEGEYDDGEYDDGEYDDGEYDDGDDSFVGGGMDQREDTDIAARLLGERAVF